MVASLQLSPTSWTSCHTPKEPLFSLRLLYNSRLPVACGKTSKKTKKITDALSICRPYLGRDGCRSFTRSPLWLPWTQRFRFLSLCPTLGSPAFPR